MADPSPPIDPDAILNQQFELVRRGYDPLTVQKYLMAIAAELRTAREHERDLTARVAAAEARAAELEDITPSKLTSLLGEETMRVLDAANSAAADIRSNAEENVARLLREAQDQASELRREAEAVLATKTGEAKAAADEIRAGIVEIQQRATVDAAAMVEAGQLEGREMVTEAQRVRERMLRDLARRRKAMRQQIDQLQAGRDRLVAAYDVVRETVDAATAELDIAVPEARRAAEDAHRHDDATLDQDVAELSAELDRLDQLEHLGTDLESTSETVDDPEPVEIATGDASPEPGAETDPTSDGEAVEDIPTRTTPGDPPDATTGHDADVEPDGEPQDRDPVPVDDIGTSAEPAAPAVKAVSIFARMKTEDPAVPDGDEQSPAGDDEQTEAEADDSETSDPSALLLRRRDDALADIVRTLSKRIKRELSDEQNELLDAVRRGEVFTADTLLPPPEAQVERYVSVTVSPLADATQAGSGFVGTASRRKAKASGSAPAEDLAAELIAPLRDRLVRGFSAADGDPDETSERIRACYREWKTQRVDGAASHAALVAFNAGLYDAITAGAKVHWITDDGDTPSPDCDDNALAGNLVKGDQFPTGHRHPPAHPSCRCLVVPVET